MVFILIRQLNSVALLTLYAYTCLSLVDCFNEVDKNICF